MTETIWERTQTARFHQDASPTLKFRVDGLEEITNWLLGWADRAKVLCPKELRDQILDGLKLGLEMQPDPVGQI